MSKKIVLFLFIIINICACKSTKRLTNTDEYEIARLTLTKYEKIPFFKIIMKPDNSLLKRYKNGILDDSLYFEKIGFSIKKDHIHSWNKNIALNDKSLMNRIQIVNDYSNVKKVDPLDAQTYFSLSNVIYSDNNRYAAIVINLFHNTNTSDNTSEGYIFIYEKIDDRWTFVTQVTAYLT